MWSTCAVNNGHAHKAEHPGPWWTAPAASTLTQQWVEEQAVVDAALQLRGLLRGTLDPAIGPDGLASAADVVATLDGMIAEGTVVGQVLPMHTARSCGHSVHTMRTVGDSRHQAGAPPSRPPGTGACGVQHARPRARDTGVRRLHRQRIAGWGGAVDQGAGAQRA